MGKPVQTGSSKPLKLSFLKLNFISKRVDFKLDVHLLFLFFYVPLHHNVETHGDSLEEYIQKSLQKQGQIIP